MPEFVQLQLPGMPVRIVVSAVWESAERPCTIRATIDAPSDQYSSQIIGTDTTGKMTPDELQGAMETMLDWAMRQDTSLLGPAVSRLNSHLRQAPNT